MCPRNSAESREAMFRRFEQRVHALVARPSKLSYYADDPKLEARLLSIKRESLDWFAYCCIFDAEYQAALYYLPYALEDAAAMVHAYGDLANKVVRWISVCCNVLAELGLYRDAISLVSEVFGCWLNAFRMHHDVFLNRVAPTLRFGAALIGGSCRDSNLSQIIEHGLLDPAGELLGDAILRQWAQQRGHPISSAHFVDMCARARGGVTIGVSAGDLYAAKVLAETLGDASLMKRHYEEAREVWRRHRAPEWYVRQIGILLQIPSL